MSLNFAHLLIVAAGGAIGAAGRHLVGLATLRLLGPGFPWGTLFVNIAGCFAMGLLIAAFVRLMPSDGALRLFLATGVLGGFTTFSAFSLDVAVLWERGAPLAATGYVVASVAGSILAVFAGLAVMRGAIP